MVKRDPHLATARSRGTVDNARGPRELAVRWVFPHLAGMTTRFEGRRVVLGRDDDCDAPLPGTETSRRHAEICYDGSGPFIRDLGSTNGVHVNGIRVERAPIGLGSLIRLGEWVGVVVFDDDPGVARSLFEVVDTGIIVGPALAPAIQAARKVAPTRLRVVLEGETGTGKERFAKAIHAWSGRTGPYLAINCGAMPENLIEAELFGHAKGAFTGADRARPGCFRAANGGTLLLDEVEALSLALQTRLLRVLQENEVLPVGESIPVSIDVRVIAAAQGSLFDGVRSGRFRADLLGRLDDVTIQIPPLRHRVEEISFLFMSLLDHHAHGAHPPPEPKLIEQLCLYDWPFNAREMDSLVRRLVALHSSAPALLRSHLPARMLERGGSGLHPPAVGPMPDKGMAIAQRPEEPGRREEDGARDERDLAILLTALRKHAGNVARAAAEAGISRQRAYRLMGNHPDLDLEAFRNEPGKGRGP